MKKGNVLILAIAATALLGGSAWLGSLVRLFALK